MADITMYGAPWCPDCRRSKKFLTEQRVPFDWIDVGQDAAALARIQEIQHGGRSIPTIVFADGAVLIEPTNEDLAKKLGLTLEAKRSCYDLAIVGGGPAGLAAAIYAAREGIDAIVIDRGALGGQASITECVDNYPGFPEGVSGADLAARFIEQATRYGVELLSAVSVEHIGRDDVEQGDVALKLGNGQDISAHAVLIATGTTYRRLNVPGEEGLIGSGLHFCATCDAPFYRGADDLMVIGGGNSALEESMYLTRFAKHVQIVQRGDHLTASSLLQDKVKNDPRFDVMVNTEIVSLAGKDGKLTGVEVRDRATGEAKTLHPTAAFVYIGQTPQTEFLRGTLELDERGFVVDTGDFNTSMPGVCVAGDVRAGSTKQLGSAVGDGIAALLAVRRYLEIHDQIAARAG
ncbi:MAG: FAD-dependent oxidoreductase [Candidatus Dormibacteraeota bacterium]|nr:FAD-dependent oxidoreductase [Candidatus Dormibacteraeota bacterium]